MAKFDLAAYPPPTSCRLIDFEDARVDPGIIPDTWFLTVRGIKPCLNMEVSLAPLVYAKCPDYWGIEVIGCLRDGICLPALGRYEVTIPLHTIGSSGIEVIGASKKEKIKVMGGCSQAADAWA